MSETVLYASISKTQLNGGVSVDVYLDNNTLGNNLNQLKDASEKLSTLEQIGVRRLGFNPTETNIYKIQTNATFL